MDFILELIFGIFFEVPLELTMESKRVKTWTKTVVFLILGMLIDLIFVFCARAIWLDRADLTGTVIMAVLGVAWTVFVIWSAIYGHKRKWKND